MEDYYRYVAMTATVSTDFLYNAGNILYGPIENPPIEQSRIKETKSFKEYSKEDFRNISKEPVIKDVLPGSSRIYGKEILARIKEHLRNIWD